MAEETPPAEPQHKSFLSGLFKGLGWGLLVVALFGAYLLYRVTQPFHEVNRNPPPDAPAATGKMHP